MATGDELQAALAEAESLLDITGIEGVGEGETADGEPCVLVMTAGPVDAAAIPDAIVGVPVRVLDIGERPTALEHGAVTEQQLAPDLEPDCG